MYNIMCVNIINVTLLEPILRQRELKRRTMRKILQLFTLLSLTCIAIANPVSNLNRGDPYFSGRSQMLSRLKQELGKKHLLQVNGISGVGKTALVAAFAQNNRNSYDVVWWINGRAELLTQCSRFLRLLEKQTGEKVPPSILQASEDGIFAYVFEKFKGKRILLIVDDVKALNGSLLRLVKSKAHQNGLDIIITSQRAFPEITSISLGSLTRDDSLELIHKFFPSSDHNQALELATELYNFPIALCQALRYMKFYNYNIPNYLSSLRKDAGLLRSDETLFIHKHKEHLATWDKKHDSADMVIKKYMKDAVSKDPGLEPVLYVLPFLAQQYVSKRFMNGYLKFAHKTIEKHQEIYNKLLESGLLMSAATGAGFHYHEIIKHMLPSNIKAREAAKRIGAYLLSLMAGQEVKNFPADEHGNREYIDHVQAYLDMCEKLGIVTQHVLKLRVLMSYYLEYVTREDDDCVKHIKMVDSSGMINKLPKYYQALHSTIRALMYYASEKQTPEQNQKNYTDFLSHWKYIKDDPECRPMKLQLTAVIMIYLLMQQKQEQIKTYVKAGDAAVETTDSPFQILFFTRIKCWYLNTIAQSENVDLIMDEVWPLFDKCLGGPLKAQYATTRTIALIKSNQLEKARKYAQLAVEEMKEYFGDRKVDMKAAAFATLGNLHVKQKNYIEGHAIITQAIEQYRDIYGKDGQAVWQIEAKLYLSQCLLGMGRKEEALDRIFEAESEFNRLIGSKAQTELIKEIYMQIIRISWQLKQPETTGRYVAEYDTRFGEMPDLDAALIKISSS